MASWSAADVFLLHADVVTYLLCAELGLERLKTFAMYRAEKRLLFPEPGLHLNAEASC